MPKTLGANLILKKNELDKGSPWVQLWRVDVGGGSFLNLTNHPRSIVYQAITYTPFPIRHEVLEQQQSGRIPQLVVHVSNVDRQVQSYLESQDGLRGKAVTLRLVNLEDLAAGDILQTFIVDSASATAQVATFVLSKTIPGFGYKLPLRIITREIFPSLPAA